MAANRLFVDTWAWLVLANDRDPAYKTVTELRAASAGRFGAWVTTDYVLDETITRLFSVAHFAKARSFIEGIFAASNESLLDIEEVTSERFRSAWELRRRFQDKPRISFTDLTSFVVMQELEIPQVISGDAHFEQVGMGFVRVP